MAEVLATMVVGPLVSMVKEKASSYLLDQYKVMEGMEEQHKLLKRKLPAILDVITDAEEQAAKNREGAKAWLEELRTVAYKANDVLDEFKYEALRRKAKAEGHYKEFGMDVIKLFPSHNRFVFRHRMANKLRMILQEVDVLIAEMNTFRFKFKPQPPMSMKWRQTDPNTPDNYVNIASDSRAKEKEEIVKALLGQGDNVDLTVLPVVGMGGMGKTTLAQLVYHDSAIQKHFQVQIWVCVSENFDVDSLFETIVKEAEKNGCQMTGGSTMEKFKSAVSEKKYLLVLDDVWNREANKWDKLRSYLHHGAPGSSVLTTTRDENIARFMGTIDAHKIEHLEQSYIENIIKKGAFSVQAQKHDDQLLNMVGDVAKRCSGSPLAATALGSVLRTKNTVQEWEAVLNRSTICDDENGILPVLKLSYNCLPPHMRQCFAFCAMFPKDHEIDVEMLIRLWMANSFIPEQKRVCPEVIGKQIFNELAQRSFFQEVQQDKFNRQITCKIHDLMHDVAQDSMGKECAAIDTKLSQSEDFPYSARHLFLSVDIEENVLNASIEKGSPAIQTLICDRSEIADVQKLSKYLRPVRALKTRQCPKYLHHLRYLDLSRSYIEALPEDITILYHLQTLNLSYCTLLEQLPKAMKYMTALRHLYTHGCRKLTSMPPNLGHLTSLQTLTCFVLGTGSGCSNMEALKNLDLGGQLELSKLENATAADAKAAKLWDKKRLEELTLIWSDDNEKEAHKEVLEGLRPHDGLKALRMYGCSSSGIPTWMLELQGMVELELEDCQNLEKLPALWQLPSLQFLYLRNLRNLHCLFSGGAPSKFQKLKMMSLKNMPNFEMWWDRNEVQGEEQILFPSLDQLEVIDCPELTTFPEAPKLRKVKLFGCREQAYLQAGSRYITSVSSLEVEVWAANKEENSAELEVVREHKSPLGDLCLRGCDLFFSGSSALALWKCFGQLATLDIAECDALVYWPEKLFQGLVSLRTLEIRMCNKLTGLTEDEASHEQSALVHRSGTLLPRLESLVIRGCESLVQVPNLSTSLKKLLIEQCKSLKSIAFGEQQDTTGLETSSSSASSNHCSFPCLQSLEIEYCGGLTEVANLPPSIKTLKIWGCGSLVSVSGEVTSLEELNVWSCRSLESLPNGPHQVYSSLRVLSIKSCDGIKQLLSSLQQCLGHLEKKNLDPHLLQEQVELDSKPESMSDGASTSVVPKQSSSTGSNHCFFPCLESLVIYHCGGLTEVANLPPSIKTLEIGQCGSLVSVSGEVPSLEQLQICDCGCLQSLPNGPHQVYSSLRVLRLTQCPGIKQLPPSLQQRLDHLELENSRPPSSSR
ncbi:putative disease resistance protein RGA4 [Miscanthus floridulus]|uniref:putative disease resistance protein RGA4 n=1 Tax=Miscanthus floridulus TaxID=154761 RepID=UPI0034594C77